TRPTEGPLVIVAKTIKGWTLGPGVEARNATHQIKKMSAEQLVGLRDRLELEDVISDEALADGFPPYVRPADGSPELEYLLGRRAVLDGFLPSRAVRTRRPLTPPSPAVFDELTGGSGGQAASSTTAFTRLLRNLCRDGDFGGRVVPIIPDEARTFGMDALFREIKIYASQGQLYEPVDHDLLLSYKESSDGQILEEGITEAGGLASWTAAATSYAHRGVPMVPFFTFYSMFGFQRIADLIWAAADARARGFLMGATAGRTTLLGEGLQHQDGHSHVLASTVPVCRSYDPAFAYEMATIVRSGIDAMYPAAGAEFGEDVFYYLTLYNENYPMPAMPQPIYDGLDVVTGIIDGLYPWSPAPKVGGPAVTLLFSGPMWKVAVDAQSLLAEHYGVGAELWSATSYQQLRMDAIAVERWNLLHPSESPRTTKVADLLDRSHGPIVAVTDFMRAVPDQVARWMPRRYTSLGTDGFGRSDTREHLRSYFETDAAHLCVAALSMLAADGTIDPSVALDAVSRFDVDPDLVVPWHG
ncbi:MAG TPA: pyruvate dehydrogenase (acetyl-transferring), homodimeric type, partial [Microthrixaceae bacterium]|nr:pyruvate dehydrogenase (acetyl-transferring), homodimeric type [Microthrixaceae bacterium]